LKEAIGGSVLIKLMMLFIVLLNTFLALTVNYTRAFRIKNKIVSLLEQYEFHEQARPYIEEYIAEIGYYIEDIDPDDCGSNISDIYGTIVGEWNVVQSSVGGGYCYRIIQDNHLGVTRGYHYQVATFIHLEFPLIIWNLNFPIHGETKVINVR